MEAVQNTIIIPQKAMKEIRWHLKNYKTLDEHIENRRKEIQGCKEQMSFEFLKQTINWNKTKLNSINEALEKNKDKKIIIFKNRKN